MKEKDVNGDFRSRMIKKSLFLAFAYDIYINFIFGHFTLEIIFINPSTQMMLFYIIK